MCVGCVCGIIGWLGASFYAQRPVIAPTVHKHKGRNIDVTDSRNPSLRSYRAQIQSPWVVLIVELLAVTVLVAGVLWLIQRSVRNGQLAATMLNLRLWALVLLVSGVGTAGNLGPYVLGRRGTDEVLARFPRLEGETWERIQTYLRRKGSSVLILSGIPTLGTVLTTAAGAFGIERNPFLRWVMHSKVIRNWLLVLASFFGLELLTGTALF